LPINIRPALLIEKDQNPKAIGLFLMALIKLKRIGILKEEDLIAKMVERLVVLRSPDTSFWCWGYSFPWQTRTIIVPRWAPNLVCTSFVANALLDMYEQTQDQEYLRMAISAGEYIVSTLYWTEPGGVASFSYPIPGLRAKTHNANFLAAALLCRIHAHNGESRFLDAALQATRFSVRQQREDGSWYYGDNPTQGWIDNFHTGFNLCALRNIGLYAETAEFEGALIKGFEFYREHFFAAEGVAKYFHNRTYPIDIHSIAQSIITLVTFREADPSLSRLAQAVFQWSIDNMWDERGYFYYQAWPYFTNRISYMRWSQAWMLLALAELHASEQALGVSAQ
jgi:hypothetical protein